MLGNAVVLATVLAVEPPADTGGASLDLTTLIPLVTGAGGALVVLMIMLYLFATDRITSVSAVARLREADNNRFNDMLAQRDSLVKALEHANTTASQATSNAQQSLALLRELRPPRDDP